VAKRFVAAAEKNETGRLVWRRCLRSTNKTIRRQVLKEILTRVFFR